MNHQHELLSQIIQDLNRLKKLVENLDTLEAGGGAVDSVNGETGTVVLDTDDIAEGATNLYLTQERVEDYVGAMLSDTSTVDLAYNDATGKITATVLPAGVDHGALDGLDDDDHTQYHNDARGDARYGQLAAANTWTKSQTIQSDETTGNVLRVVRDLASASTDAPVVDVVQDNAGDDQAALRVQQDGTGSVAELYDGATLVLRVADGGDLIVTGDARIDSGLLELNSTVRSLLGLYSSTRDYQIWVTNSAGTPGPEAAAGDLVFYDLTAEEVYATLNPTEWDFTHPVVVTGGDLTVRGGVGASNSQSIKVSNHAHGSAYFRRWFTHGLYQSSTRIDVIDFDMNNFTAVNFRVSYSQFNTGTGSDEPRLGLAVGTITQNSIGTYPVKSVAYLDANHVTVGIDTSGPTVTIYLNRTGGTTFRNTNTLRNVCIEVAGIISNVVLRGD